MSEHKKQFEVLKRASLFLQQNNCEPNIAEILLRHYLQMDQAQFYAHMHEKIQLPIIEQLWQSIEQHVETGIPVQHITRYEYFFGRKFCVNEHVLIPRPETEELVEKAISEIKQHHAKEHLSIVDLGTGSGIIAITLALEFPEANVYATDISQKALEIAKRNASKHQVDINFMLGNFAEPLINHDIQVELIISNPPYIDGADKRTLSRTVKDFDPEVALFASHSGLAAYEVIVEQAKSIIRPNGKILFEIGYDQGESVSQLIKQNYPTSHVHVSQDINGQDRMVCATISTKNS